MPAGPSKWPDPRRGAPNLLSLRYPPRRRQVNRSLVGTCPGSLWHKSTVQCPATPEFALSGPQNNYSLARERLNPYCSASPRLLPQLLGSGVRLQGTRKEEGSASQCDRIGANSNFSGDWRGICAIGLKLARGANSGCDAVTRTCPGSFLVESWIQNFRRARILPARTQVKDPTKRF